MSVAQNVTAAGGYAYGVIGADIHVHGDGRPLYLLQEFGAPSNLDREWLRELPSRMLNAKSRIVPFRSVRGDAEKLTEWVFSKDRLAIRWLYAPGGRGKTRLADQLTTRLAAEGWKVVTAAHGLGAVVPSPGSSDLRLTDVSGVLVVADYADRWPISHLEWLLNNSLLYSELKTRVLLIGRTATAWPAIRGALANIKASTSEQFLSPVPQDQAMRERMFKDAVSAFSDIFETDHRAVDASIDLSKGEFDLILSLHVAALVAVDSAVSGEPKPTDPRALTTYLLDRERHHWSVLYESRLAGLSYSTPPRQMARLVLAGSLAGPVERALASQLILRSGIGDSSDTLLDDHYLCYPPPLADKRLTLQALQPDRLAEDFVGLSIPRAGSQSVEEDAASFRITEAALIRDEDGQLPPYVGSVLTVLAAACQRWPEVATTVLAPALTRDPRMAYDAGGPALGAIAQVDGLSAEVLAVIFSAAPQGSVRDVDDSIALLAERVINAQLKASAGESATSELYLELGRRYANAGRFLDAVSVNEEAIARLISQPEDEDSSRALAIALSRQSVTLWHAGYPRDAIDTTTEALVYWRKEFERTESIEDAHGLSIDLANASIWSLGEHKYEESYQYALECVHLRELLVEQSPEEFRCALATGLVSLSNVLSEVGRTTEALEASERAVGILRLESATNQSENAWTLARALTNYAADLSDLGDHSRALPPALEAVDLHRQMVDINSRLGTVDLARGLQTLSTVLSRLGRPDESISIDLEAIEIWRALAAREEQHELSYAQSVASYAMTLLNLDRLEEAGVVIDEVLNFDLNRLETPDALELRASLIHYRGLLRARSKLIPEAIDDTMAAAWLYSKVTPTNPTKWLAPNARVLLDLGALLFLGGRIYEIRAPILALLELLDAWGVQMQEAEVEILGSEIEKLIRFHAPAAGADLPLMLNNLGSTMGNYLTGTESAVRLLSDSADLIRVGLNRNDDLDLTLFMGVLTNLASFLLKGRDWSRAGQIASEALAVITAIDSSPSGATLDELQESAAALGAVLDQLERTADKAKLARFLN